MKTMPRTRLLAVLAVICFVFPGRVKAEESVIYQHKPGSLVRDGQTIFLVGKGFKQGFASLNEFLSYRYRLSRIVMANSADRQLSEGPSLRAKAGSLVLDAVDHKTVYLIGKQGQKQGITSPVAFWKYKKKNTILWLIDVTNYPVGNNIE